MGERSKCPTAWEREMRATALDTIWSVERKQTLVQLTQTLLRRLDERAAREGRSRSALIRDAIEDYLHDEEQAEISRRIVEGYERIPQTDEEMAGTEREVREAIREEPWWTEATSSGSISTMWADARCWFSRVTRRFPC